MNFDNTVYANPTLINLVSGAPYSVQDLSMGSNKACAVVKLQNNSIRSICWGVGGSVTDIGAFSTIAVGYSHVCGRVSGVTMCTGGNDQHQVTNNPTNSNWGDPITVATWVTKLGTQVTTGYDSRHNCFIENNRISCWGSDNYGQLGDGRTLLYGLQDFQATSGINGNGVYQIPSITDAQQLSLGQYHSCVLRSNGVVACWGRLGNDLNQYNTTPEIVQGL